MLPGKQSYIADSFCGEKAQRPICGETSADGLLRNHTLWYRERPAKTCRKPHVQHRPVHCRQMARVKQG
jgi:hypothetical protein